MVETRDFKQLEAPYLIASDHVVSGAKPKSSGKGKPYAALEAVQEDDAPRGILNGMSEWKLMKNGIVWPPYPGTLT